jgi:hypothetical protein
MDLSKDVPFKILQKYHLNLGDRWAEYGGIYIYIILAGSLQFLTFESTQRKCHN